MRNHCGISFFFFWASLWLGRWRCGHESSWCDCSGVVNLWSCDTFRTTKRFKKQMVVVCMWSSVPSHSTFSEKVTPDSDFSKKNDSWLWLQIGVQYIDYYQICVITKWEIHSLNFIHYWGSGAGGGRRLIKSAEWWTPLEFLLFFGIRVLGFTGVIFGVMPSKKNNSLVTPDEIMTPTFDSEDVFSVSFLFECHCGWCTDQ